MKINRAAPAIAFAFGIFAGLYCGWSVTPAAAADWAAVAASCKPSAIRTQDNDIRLDEDDG